MLERTVDLQARFPPGQTMATPAVLKALEQCGDAPAPYLDRHICGDWGDVDPDDRLANEDAVLSGDRILSVYRMSDGTRFWIITEAVDDTGKRQTTTLLLPEEY